MAMVIVMMGVSGAGKTTVGRRLADALDAGFAEGDAYHPPENIEKMRRGVPLDDADRWPWLDRLSRAIGEWLSEGRTMVLACSALKQSYRDRLAAGRPGVHFVFLKGDEGLIRARLELRRGHYMPPTLLPSQLAALEEPSDAIAIDIAATADAIAARIREQLEHRAEPSKARARP